MDTLPAPHITEFVVQLLNVGHTVVGLVENIAEALTAAATEGSSRHPPGSSMML